MSTTLSSLVADIRILSGLLGNQFLTDTEIASMASDSWKGLYDRFVEANQHYSIKSMDFTLVGGLNGNSVALPADFQLGNGLQMSPNLVRPFSIQYLSNWLNRNNLGASVLNNSFQFWDGRQYCFSGSNLEVFPADRSAGDYRLFYTPMAETLEAKQTYAINLPNDVTRPQANPLQFNISNAAFTTDMIGGILTINFTGGTAGANAWANGTYTITNVLSPTLVETSGDAGSNNLTDPTAGTLSVVWQNPGTTDTLPTMADPWALYIKLETSIAIREARQQDVNDLERRFKAQQDRVDSALENRQEEATQPPLTRDRGFWDSL